MRVYLQDAEYCRPHRHLQDIKLAGGERLIRTTDITVLVPKLPWVRPYNCMNTY